MIPIVAVGIVAVAGALALTLLLGITFWSTESWELIVVMLIVAFIVHTYYSRRQ